MSEEQLKAFLEKVKFDTNLQEKLKATTDFDAVTEIAKEVGISISADDLTKIQLELSEEELEGIAGSGCWLLAKSCMRESTEGTQYTWALTCGYV